MRQLPFSNQLPRRKVFSVSELTASIRTLLETKYPIIWVTGEVSNFKRPTSGHYYFTLKDKTAQINAVMFRLQNQQLKFKIENGLQINVLGRLTVYAPYGNYQIVLEHAEPEGLGALQLAFEQLKKRLAAEGLFDQKYKQSLPFIPEHISVVTSPQGAVIHDIMNVLTQRFLRPVQIVPVNVQGQRAPSEIIAAIQMINEQQRSDLIVLARGGGSLEDLQAFNNEHVARAVFKSQIPVVSAIGHETDYTIVDFVADFRAPTPSAAVSQIVPERRELLNQLNASRNKLVQIFSGIIQYRRLMLKNLTEHLKTPEKLLEEVRSNLDQQTQKLFNHMNRQLSDAHNHLNHLKNRMIIACPQKQIQTTKNELQWQTRTLISIIQKNIETKRSKLEKLQGRLTALDPYAILKRGYSVTRRLQDHTIITNAEHVKPGQQLNIMLETGHIQVIVEKVFYDST